MKHRHRRKPSTCVLCKEEETYDWDYICSDCRQSWKMGEEYQQLRMPEGTREVLIALYWNLYHFNGVVRRYDEFREYGKGSGSRLRNAVLALVGAVQTSHRWTPKLTGAIGLPKNKRGSDSVSRYIIVGDEKTEQAMRDLYEAACDLMAEAYKDGESRGKSFVTDLAEGKLTTKDLERL